MKVIVSNQDMLDHDFTVECKDIESLFSALYTVHTELSDNHIHIEFVDNEKSIYSTTINNF